MKPSIDLMQEYAEQHQPHGWKALADFLETTTQQVSIWKRRGGMSAAATIKVGMDLGYSRVECLEIVAVEAERTQKGKRFLLELAGYDKPASQFGGKGRF